MKPCLYITLIVLIILASCSPPVPFTNPVINTPIIKKKNDAAVYATGNFDHIELQGNYALSKRWGVAATGLYGGIAYDHKFLNKTGYGDLSVLYYYPVRKDKMYIDIMLGGGGGHKYVSESYPLISRYGAGELTHLNTIADYYNISSQFDLRFHSKKYTLIFSQRFTWLWLAYYTYDNSLIKYYNYLYWEKQVWEDIKCYYFSPALTYLSAPGHLCKLKVQLRYDYIPRPRDFYSTEIYNHLPELKRPVTLTVGVIYDFNAFKKKLKDRR